MDQEKSRLSHLASQKQDADDEYDSDITDTSTSTESLLSLVQPEMSTLSRHWLAALKDYALLSLPAGRVKLLTAQNRCDKLLYRYVVHKRLQPLYVTEYSSQLPSDGGAFYTSDTMDSSRPYYKKAWPPILYAASLWLKETGFINVDKDNSRPANMKEDVSDTNRFHLLIGMTICCVYLFVELCVKSYRTSNVDNIIHS